MVRRMLVHQGAGHPTDRVASSGWHGEYGRAIEASRGGTVDEGLRATHPAPHARRVDCRPWGAKAVRLVRRTRAEGHRRYDGGARPETGAAVGAYGGAV